VPGQVTLQSNSAALIAAQGAAVQLAAQRQASAQAVAAQAAAAAALTNLAAPKVTKPLHKTKPLPPSGSMFALCNLTKKNNNFLCT
jgi:hypothetical protein